jgi:alpha-tubulin suppressor-like RCC1 family protein
MRALWICALFGCSSPPNASPADATAPLLDALDALAPSSVGEIAIGGNSSCEITTDHALVCWGQIAGSNVPTIIASGVSQVALSTHTTCVLTIAGAVQCWGDGTNGQLGNGQANTSSSTPITVTGLGAGVIAIAAGDAFECALTSAGAVMCWGSAYLGELGDGQTTTDRLVPNQVTGLDSGVTAIAAGSTFACALRAGAVSCWGYAVVTGSNSGVPTAVAGLTSATSVAAGRDHACAVASNTLVCWGNDAFGQLGDGLTNPTTAAAPTTTMTDVAHVVAGNSLTCTISTAGAAACVGSNFGGQLGANLHADSITPVTPVGGSSGVTQLAAYQGSNHVCGVFEGVVECWGYDGDDEIGNSAAGESTATPIAVVGL